MMVFVDTSAFYAVLDRAGENHAAALRRWDRILSDDVAMVSSNYVLVETCALLQNRIGLEAVRTFPRGRLTAHPDRVDFEVDTWLGDRGGIGRRQKKAEPRGLYKFSSDARCSNPEG